MSSDSDSDSDVADDFDNITNESDESDDTGTKKVVKVCSRCNKKFKLRSDLNRHMNKKTPCDSASKEQWKTNKKTCPHCDKVLASPQALKKHLTSCFKKKIADEMTKTIHEQEQFIKKIVGEVKTQFGEVVNEKIDKIQTQLSKMQHCTTLLTNKNWM